MSQESYCSSPHTVKRISDNKIFQVRCCKIPNADSFDIVWQVFKNGKWKRQDSICSPLYSFYVEPSELKGLQFFIDL